MSDLIQTISEVVSQSNRILVISGAGISAESGIPTYRGIGGLYHQKLTKEKLPIETVLSGPFFNSNPAVTWNYLLQIENACRHARPNAAHKILAKWQDRAEIWILTQNIDSLHSRAGSKNIIEIHGNLYRLKCLKCAWQSTVDNFSNLASPPSCPECRCTIRPDVVLFEELLPLSALNRLDEELAKGFNAVFSVGTSSLFPYISAPVIQLRNQGAVSIEINPDETHLSPFVNFAIRSHAVDTFQKLDDQLTLLASSVRIRDPRSAIRDPLPTPLYVFSEISAELKQSPG